MYYKVKEFLTEATKAYLSSIDRTDIVVQQGTNNALNQKKISSKHNANISQDSIIESKTESKNRFFANARAIRKDFTHTCKNDKRKRDLKNEFCHTKPISLS